MKLDQLTVFSILMGTISIGALLYVMIASPQYLRKTREGTPYFTPPVMNPDDGKPLEVDELIRHYKGDT